MECGGIVDCEALVWDNVALVFGRYRCNVGKWNVFLLIVIFVIFSSAFGKLFVVGGAIAVVYPL
jgi:hypothetical protein